MKLLLKFHCSSFNISKIFVIAVPSSYSHWSSESSDIRTSFGKKKNIKLANHHTDIQFFFAESDRLGPHVGYSLNAFRPPLLFSGVPRNYPNFSGLCGIY